MRCSYGSLGGSCSFAKKVSVATRKGKQRFSIFLKEHIGLVRCAGIIDFRVILGHEECRIWHPVTATFKCLVADIHNGVGSKFLGVFLDLFMIVFPVLLLEMITGVSTKRIFCTVLERKINRNGFVLKRSSSTNFRLYLVIRSKTF